MSEHEWMKIKTVAQYADISPRTAREWLKRGLKHSRLPSGTILVKREWIDGYLEKYSGGDDVVDGIVKEMTEGLC